MWVQTLTPAIAFGAGESYEAAVFEVARIDNCGVALIVTLDEFNSLVHLDAKLACCATTDGFNCRFG
jgi:hypothetical protein